MTEKELEDRAKEKKAKKVKKVKLNEKMLQEYITLEKAVFRLERKNVIKKYEQKMIAADELKKTVDQLEATYKELKKQTEKERADMENIEAAVGEDLLEIAARVSLAMFKWTNGRVLLVHANTQMAFGISRWSELKKIESANGRMRYFAAAEARNNFIAAGQNVQSCRVYLGKVQFPYATEDEMTEMENTVNTAFKDVQNDGTIDKAGRVFQETHVNHVTYPMCKEELGHDMSFEYDHVADNSWRRSYWHSKKKRCETNNSAVPTV
ncbi:unnamed protein product, partial [Mesorhabditis spiculigera]